jgi:hypothetical protein
LRRGQGLLLLVAGILTLLAFQNCTQYSFRSLSDDLELSSLRADNGVPYDGKPDSTFYRFVPEFSCEGQSSVKDRIEVRDGKFYLFENHLQKCAAQSRELESKEIIRSPLQNDSVSVKDFIYTRYEGGLTTIPDSVEEVLCRDDFANPRIEIITKYNQSLKTSSTKVYSLEGTSAVVNIYEDLSTARAYSGASIEYSVFSGELGFKVSLDQTIPGEARRYNAEVTQQLGLWSGKISSKKLVCITGLYAAPIETLPLSFKASIRGDDNIVLSSVSNYNGKLIATSVISPYTGEIPSSPFTGFSLPKPTMIGIYQSLDNGYSWNQLAKVKSSSGSSSYNPKLVSNGTSLYLYGANRSNEVFVIESKDQGSTWGTVMQYRPPSYTFVEASGAVISNDNHILISGYGRLLDERTSFVRKCNLQTWSCTNSQELTSYSWSYNQTTQIRRDGIGNLYIAHRSGATQSTSRSTIKKSTDNGATWIDLDQSNLNPDDINALAVSPDGQMILYGGDRSGSRAYLRQSTDGGLTWIETNPVCIGKSVTNIIILPNKDALLSCYDYARIIAADFTALVYKKAAAATSWTELFRLPGSKGGALYTLPSGEIYYHESDFSKLLVSSDMGSSWTSGTYSLGKAPSLGDAEFFSMLENSLGNMYVAGYVTIAPNIRNAVVYKSIDSGISWSLEYHLGAVNTSFRSIAKSSVSNNMIVGGTQNFNGWVSHKYNALTSSWGPSDSFVPANGAFATMNQVVAGSSGKFWEIGSAVIGPSLARHWLVRGSTDDGNSWSTLEDFQLYSGFPSEANAGAALGGELYVAGFGVDTNQYSHWLVRKYSSGGAISTDDENGFANDSASVARGLLAASDGTLYAVGEYNLALGAKHWVVKKKPKGGQWSVIDDYSLDPGADAIAYSVSEDSAQRIVVAGSARDAKGKQFSVVRVLSSLGWNTIDSYSQPAATISYGSSACLQTKVCIVGSYLDADGMYRGFFRSLRTDGSP